MLNPTTIFVTVRQAKNLIIKAKDGKNKSYATIELLKEKYVTEIETSLQPRWFTECSFPVSSDYFRSEKAIIAVCVYSKSYGFRGFEPDSFLGQIQIPLSTLHHEDERERIKWFKLCGRKNVVTKDRGEIELSFRFQLQDRNIKSGKSSIRANLLLSDASPGKSTGTKQSPLPSRKNLFVEVLGKLKPNASNHAINAGATSSGKSLLTIPKPEKDMESKDNSTANDNVTASNLVSDSSSPYAGQQKRSLSRTKVASDVELYDSNDWAKQFDPDITDTTEASSQGELKSLRRFHSWHDVAPVELESVQTGATASRGPSTSVETKRRSSIGEKKHFVSTHNKFKNYWNFISGRNKDSYSYQLDDSIPEDGRISFTSMTRFQLIDVVRNQQQLLVERDIQIKEMKDYIDKLLVKVMSQNPQILEGSPRTYHY